MSKFIIEKDVPMPEKHVGKYPLSDMEVGDSFLAPFCPEDVPVNYGRLASAAYNSKVGTFKVRRVDGGVRVWRVS